MPPHLKPIILATHPRAVSTAFELVMMQNSSLNCIHEPFGDAYYFGRERLGSRYEADPEARAASGFEDVTYKNVVDKIVAEHSKKRVFIKDIAHYLIPPPSSSLPVDHLAPSLFFSDIPNGDKSNGEPLPPPATTTGSPFPPSFASSATDNVGNPTVIPIPILRMFQWTFLIRHPRSAIPSYYRCTQPPLCEKTGFKEFLPEEAGYKELRELVEYLQKQGVLGEQIVMVDADDLLDAPEKVIKGYCESVGVAFDDGMLSWEQNCAKVAKKFEKWKGFHEDAIHSSGLKARTTEKKAKTEEEEDNEWADKWGGEAAELIRKTVNENIKDYEWLRQFKMDPVSGGF